MFLILISEGLTGIKFDGLGAVMDLGETPGIRRELSVFSREIDNLAGSGRIGSSSAWSRFPWADSS